MPAPEKTPAASTPPGPRAYPAWRKPDRDKFINPWDNKTLLDYFLNLRRAYGFIKLLGLPQLRDNPDLPIESLFVEPEFAESNISPDRPVADWPARISLTTALTTHPRLVVLGDPGLGKTSLIQWIVMQFCRAGTTRIQEQLGSLVPLVFTLRELPLTEGMAWSDLLKLFLNQPVAKPLRENLPLLEKMLESGQAVILLDGLDEISSPKLKESLRTAVMYAGVILPRCRVLMTSRVAGYDQSPFHDFEGVDSSELHARLREENGDQGLLYRLGRWGLVILELGGKVVVKSKLLYLAPFNDTQTESFVRNWYTEREADHARRDDSIRELVKAIRTHPGTERLARVPNLLTMMALIHRQRAQLPQGRVNLYRDIAEAYLHSIDDFRGLNEHAYTLAQKKQWLARLGFEMQSRRTENPQDQEAAGVVLDSQQAIIWLAEAMTGNLCDESQREAEKFLDYLKRRTGLFTERSPGQWAFLHLSFQEYFAACFLMEEVTSPDWLQEGYSREGCRPQDLQGRAAQAIWKETFIFLFEMLGQERPRWADSVGRKVFARTLKEGPLRRPPDHPRGHTGISMHDMFLLADLSVDAYSGFSDRLRSECWQAVWRCHFVPELGPHFGWADGLLTGAPHYLHGVWAALTSSIPPEAKTFHFYSFAALEDLSKFCVLTSIEKIIVYGGQIRQGLSALASLPKLSSLQISWAGSGEELQALGQATLLNTLAIINTSQVNLAFLPKLTKLRELAIHDCLSLSHPESLSQCDKLESVTFTGFKPKTDWTWLKYLPALKQLSLGRIGKSAQRLIDFPISNPVESLGLYLAMDISRLSPCPVGLLKTRHLTLYECSSLRDLDGLEQLADLETVELWHCKELFSLSALLKCPKLKSVTIRDCSNLKEIPPTLAAKVRRE